MMIGVLLKVSSYNVTLRIRSFLKSVLLVPSIKSISISDGSIVVRHFFNDFDLDIVRFSIRKKDILWEESNFGLMNQDFLTLVRLTLKFYSYVLLMHIKVLLSSFGRLTLQGSPSLFVARDRNCIDGLQPSSWVKRIILQFYFFEFNLKCHKN